MNIQFLDSAKSGCKGAVLPVVVQETPITFNTTTDGTVATVITAGAAGDPAAYGGSFINKGCEDLNLTATYLSGSTCDSCDTETITTVDIDIVVPANTVFDIPAGFWTQLSYTLVNAATDVKPQTVTFQSFYTPDCPECVVVIPDSPDLP